MRCHARIRAQLGTSRKNAHEAVNSLTIRVALCACRCTVSHCTPCIMTSLKHIAPRMTYNVVVCHANHSKNSWQPLRPHPVILNTVHGTTYVVLRVVFGAHCLSLPHARCGVRSRAVHRATHPTLRPLTGGCIIYYVLPSANFTIFKKHLTAYWV